MRPKTPDEQIDDAIAVIAELTSHASRTCNLPATWRMAERELHRALVALGWITAGVLVEMYANPMTSVLDVELTMPPRDHRDVRSHAYTVLLSYDVPQLQRMGGWARMMLKRQASKLRSDAA